jgi:hypothetical protein
MDFDFNCFVRKHLSKEKKEFSRDAVEILLKLCWDEAINSEIKARKEREREEKHGPSYI